MQARRVTTLLASLALTVVSGCGASFRAFPLQATMWHDDDMRPFGRQPPEQFNPWAWDAIDNTTFRQASQLLAYERDHEATNVNALDEVPDSSWFTNRIGRGPMGERDLARGSCTEVDAPAPPYTVTRSKPNGSGPGLVVESADGRTFLFKVDLSQPERATAADAIATRIFHAAGYFVPCNRVIHYRPEDFVLAEDARTSGPNPRPITRADVDLILEQGGPAPEGLHRGSLSEYIDGTPLGGWRFEGRRDDDPNDVIEHQDRREVRGMYILAAWLNHVDSRAENNMDSWIETSEGHGYVRHFVLDAGDSFGIEWPVDAAMSRRFGYSHYLDLEQVGVDFVTLGLLQRPYDESPARPAHPTFGYYRAADFTPRDWRNGYPNPGYERRTERDMAWMTRIVARMGPEQMRILVDQGHWSNPSLDDELLAILLARRRTLLETFLTRLSPLAWPEAARQGESVHLCMEDVAVTSGLRPAETRRYETRLYRGLPPVREDAASTVTPTETGLCVDVPLEVPTEQQYVVVDVIASTEGEERTAPARVHMYVLPNGGAQVVGLERPDSDSAP